MNSGNRANLPTILSGIILALALVSAVVWAQEPVSVAQDSPNPTLRVITPRQDQSPFQQQADERECFDKACEQTGWNPYEAYDELVALGYAVELTRKDREEGLVCLAYEGAVTGAVAGEMLGVPRRGAGVGAAIAVAGEVIRSDYLCREEDPEAQRAVAAFERKLRDWDHRFSGCVRSKGYRVPTS